MAKTAVKQVWRHPETRLAFVYFADADTGAALSSLDGYNISEAGSNINAPIGAQPASTQPAAASAQEQPPVNTPLTASEARGGGEAFAPESRAERAAKAQEMMSRPGATVNGKGIVSVPTPSSGGFMSYDPNTGWSAYTNKDGITTTFDAQGNILGGPGLAPQLGTKSGAFLGDGLGGLKGIPALGSVLTAILGPVIGKAVSSVVDGIIGQKGTKNPDGTYSYNVGEGLTQQTTDLDPASIIEAPVNAGYISPASEQSVDNISSSLSNAPSGSGNFSFGNENVSGWETDGQGVYNNLDGTISGGRTTPTGVTSGGFLGGVSQSFTSLNTNNEFSGGRTGFGDKDVIDALNAAAEEAGLDGWTNEDAIAFAANFAVENAALNGNWDAGRKAYGQENSIGLAQWNGPAGRIAALNSFAKSRNLDPLTLEAQSKFTINELQTTYKGAWGAIKSAKTLDQKTAAVAMHYEKPANLQNSLSTRTAVASRMALGDFKGPAQTTVSNTSNPLMGTFNATAPTQSLATQRGMTGINEGNIAKRSIEARTEEEDNLSTLNSINSLPAGILSGPEAFYTTVDHSRSTPAGNTGVAPSAPKGWESTGKGVFDSLTTPTTAVSPVDVGFNIAQAPVASFPADSFAGKSVPGIAQITGNPFGVGALGFTRDVAPITNVGPTIDNAIAANIAAATTNQPQAALSAWTPTYAEDIGVPNPNAISALGLGPRAVQTTPISSPKSEDKSWQQSFVDTITPTIAPAIGWAIGKALENYGPQKEQTPLGSVADPRGSLTTQPSFVSSNPAQQGPVPYGMEESYLDYLAEKENESRSKLAPSITQDFTSNTDQGRSVFSNISDLAAAAYGGGGGGGFVSTAGPSGGLDSGVYSGPSGWESSGGGVWDSLGSGSAIDYGGGDSYGRGGWANSAGSATGTAGSGVSSAGSRGAGTAGNSGRSGSTGSASSGVGTAGSATGTAGSGVSSAGSASSGVGTAGNSGRGGKI